MTHPDGLTRDSLGTLVLALLQAFALWALHDAVKSGVWPATDPAALPSLYLVVVVVPLTLWLLFAHRREPLLWIFVGALAAFLLWSGRYMLEGVTGPVTAATLDEEDAIAGYVLPLVVAWLIAIPILRVRLETGRWQGNYPVLFRSAWRNVLTLAETALFTGVFWVLLALWAGLFSMLGIDFFKVLFADPRFVYPATTFATALAVQLIGKSLRLIDGVLDQLLGLLKWLAPLAGLIVVLFSIALLPKLPALFASGEKVIDSAVLLALVALTLLLINAAYRDGETEPEYGRVLRQALRGVPPLLTLVALTALASVVIRTLDLGLTPSRYWGLVTAVFAVMLSAGYAAAALRSGPWLGDIRRVNFAIALALLAVLVVSLTPFASPIRWSIAHQVARATTPVSADEREGALRFLRFDSGALGRRALGSLAADSERNVDPVLRAEAKRIEALQSKKTPPAADPTATPARYAAWRSRLRILPEGSPVPAALEQALEREFKLGASELDPGGNAPVPRLVFMDLTSDGTLDALLISGTLRGDPQLVRDYRAFLSEGEAWSAVRVGGSARR